MSIRTLAASSAFLLASLANAAAPPAAAPLKLPELKYETFTLPNGLKVITHEDHRLPLVAVDLWYHVGPLNERPGRTGFAHLFEHMMFEGSEHVGEKAHFKYVEGAGGTDINGTTDFDRTNYFETLPANQLELGLWLESDRMGFLMEGLDRKLLQNQRDVVRNERRQGEGQPYQAAQEEVFHLLFPKVHPYYAFVIGSHADIEAARIADIRDFHQQFYTPNNATLAIAGDFSPAQLKALLTKYFAPIPMGPKVEPVNVTTPAITAQKRSTVTDTVTLPRMDIAWLTPAIYTPGSYAADAAIYALGGAKTSRLRQALIYKNQVAQSVNCYNYSLKLTGIAACSITARPNVKLEDLEATVWAEISKLQQTGPTAEEIEAYKATTMSSRITGLQRLGGFGGVADTLDNYELYTGDPGYLPKDIAATEAVTLASAQASAKQFLTKDSAVVVYCVPGKKVLNDVPRSPDDTDADVKITNPYTAEFEAQQSAFRKTAPPAGPPVSVHLPVPQTFTLANGLKVYFVREPSLPILSGRLVVRAGSETNPAGKSGLAAITARTMAEATTSLNLTQLSEAEERIGTRINTATNMDGAGVSFTVLTNHSAEALGLFSGVIEHPAFAPEDLDRLRKQRLVSIQQETDNVSSIAQRVGPRVLYGDQPYGRTNIGSTESLTALTRADVTSFYDQHIGPADSALFLVGDVTDAEAHTFATKYFGSWSGSALPPAPLPPPPAAPTTHIVLVDKPGAPQTSLSVYGFGVPASSPDLQILDTLNYTLGGAFSSRINMNLREKNGYTYGAFSYFANYRGGGPFVAGSLVRTDVTAPAAKELMNEVRNFPVTPSTPEELKQAQDAQVQSLPGQFETTDGIAEQLAPLFLYDRPLDFYANLAAKYRAVTPADIQRVAKEDIHPDHVIILAVGDRSKIEPGLKDAGLGPIEYRTPTGDPIK